jgi:fatty-acyl-CoA synthase
MLQSQNEHPTLFSLFEGHADDKPLLILADGGIVTYGEVRERALAVAAGLEQLGLKRGDRVAVMLPNMPEWLVVAAACWRLGLGIMAMNVRLGAKEVGDLIARTEAKAVFYAPGYRDGLSVDTLERTAAEKLTSVKLMVDCLPGARSYTPTGTISKTLAAIEQQGNVAGGMPQGAGEPNDPCLFFATSGTTSAPKLVVHVQERVARHARDCAETIRFVPHSKVLLAIPFCGAFGFTIAVSTIAGGQTIVLMDMFDPKEAGELVNRHGVTHVMGTNDMLDKMLKATAAERPFPTLEYYGHANFTPGLVDLPAEADRRGVKMRGFFGLSETLAFVAAQSLEGTLERRAEGGGHLTCPTATFRIRDPESGRDLGLGEVGEIQIKTPNSMIGYLNDPVKTAEAFTEDGFLRTGDFGKIDADGGFTFISRMNDMLRIGGYLVSPVEIEDVIKSTGNIAIAQVVAVTIGQSSRPVAFVVPEGDVVLDEARILEKCRAELAVYKVPVAIFQERSLPVTEGPNGAKVKKNELRAMAEERLAKAV